MTHSIPNFEPDQSILSQLGFGEDAIDGGEECEECEGDGCFTEVDDEGVVFLIVCDTCDGRGYIPE